MSTEIRLKTSHILISPDTAEQLFDASECALICYKPEDKALLLAPVTNTFFGKLHEPSQVLMKVKDILGTRSIPVRNILLDNDLDETDRPLPFRVNEKNKFIRISLA